MLYQLLSALLLFLCHNVKVGMILYILLEKIRNFLQVYLKGYQCSFTLTNNIVITSINRVINLILIVKNLLRNHQMKNFGFSLLIFN